MPHCRKHNQNGGCHNTNESHVLALRQLTAIEGPRSSARIGSPSGRSLHTFPHECLAIDSGVFHMSGQERELTPGSIGEYPDSRILARRASYTECG